MAGELRPTVNGVVSKPIDTAYRRSTVDFKAVGHAVTATVGNGVTPRKFIKILHHVVTTLEKHKLRLSAEQLKAVKDLSDLVNEAAHSYSSAAGGKVHYYLMEDYQLRKLQAAAAVLYNEISNLAKLSTYTAPDFQADISDVMSKLSNCRCSLQPSQMQLIEEFKAVASSIDPSADISDAAQKIAEQVVRKVIVEVHGPFFNDEILEKEITHLEKAASHINPETHRYEAACVKLLASTLMNLDGDEPADDDYDSLAPGSVDPFSAPSFEPSTVRLVDPRQAVAAKGVTAATTNGSPPRRLTIEVSGDGSPSTTPRQHFVHLGEQPAISGSIPAHMSPLGHTSTTPLSPLTPTAALAGAAAAPTAAAAADSNLGQGSPQGSRLDQTAAWAAAAAADLAHHPGQMLGPDAAAGGSSSTPQQQQLSDGMAELRTGESSLARATSQKALEEFIDSNTAADNRESRKACLFHAQMRLPREGLEKLASFLESSGRVRGLSLAHNWIGPEGMERLCEAMCVNKSVKTLDLPDNKLGDAGAICIAQLLQSGSKVTSLQLSHNEIGDNGMIALAEAISQTRSLEKLSVYSNNITSVGCAALTAAVVANPNLKVVEFLPGNDALTKDIKALARAVKQNRKFKIFHLFGKQCAN